MFPSRFADAVVARYTSVGDVVLDPFAGRGTAVFSAAAAGRCGLGVEINPVGWVYAAAKLAPAPREAVAEAICRVGARADRYAEAAERLPEFFRAAFWRPVRRFLCAARGELDWRTDAADRTAMALLLVHLHGKREASLSNQMRQTKSMYPDYAVRWWRERRMRPPRRDPVTFLLDRLGWRYARGRPAVCDSAVLLGDSVELLPRLARRLRRSDRRVRLLLTSPPYYGVTNYHHDQWLRLWLLGGRADARRVAGCDAGPHRGKFEDRLAYRQLLTEVFAGCAGLLADDAVIYVRTDHRDFTRQTTVSVLAEVFPQHRLSQAARPFLAPTQTRLFGDARPRAGEVDLLLLPRRSRRFASLAT